MRERARERASWWRIEERWNIQQIEGERNVDGKTTGEDMQREKGTTRGCVLDIGPYGVKLKLHVQDPSVCTRVLTLIHLHI